MFNRRLAALGSAAVILLAACSSSGSSAAPSAAAPSAAAPSAAADRALPLRRSRHRPQPPPARSASRGTTSRSRAGPSSTSRPSRPRSRPVAGPTSRTTPSRPLRPQATNVENLISQGANVADHPRAGRHGHQAVRRLPPPRPGIPVIAYDRLIEDPSALYVTFDNKLVGHAAGAGDLRQGAEGQLRDHQGQQGRRQRRLPARRHGRGHRCRGRRPATSRSPASSTPTTGIRRTRRPRWSSSSRRPTTRSTPFSPRTTAWPAASSPLSLPRALTARCRCRARTATPPALNRVALGTQTVDVWKDARVLGKAAGEAAVALCANKDVKSVAEHGAVHEPRRQQLTSIFLTPTRSPRPTSRSSSTPDGSTWPRCARASRRVPSPPARRLPPLNRS